jgi:outer membrane protein TolC
MRRFRYSAIVALCFASAWAAAQTKPGADQQLESFRRPPDKPLAESPGLDKLNQVLSAQTITMDNAVHIALAINPALATAKASFYIAQGRVSEAYSALNPTLGSILTGLRYNQEQTTTTLVAADPITLATPIGKRVATENIQQQIVALGIQLPLDISGSLNAAGEEARFQRLQYQLDINRATNDVVTEVKTAFYAVLRARALRTVAEENLKNAQLRFTDAQNKYVARVVTKFDVLRAQVDVANDEQELITARNQVESLYAVLNNVIGIKVNTRLHATDAGALKEPPSAPLPPPSAPGTNAVTGATAGSPATATAPQPHAPPSAPTPGVTPVNANQVPATPNPVSQPEFNTDLQEALNDRPEISQAKAGINASDWEEKYARRSELPSAGVGWGYYYAPEAPGLHPYTHTWILQAQLNVPIFDGGLARARIQEAKGDIANATTLVRTATDRVTLEVEQAFLNVQEASARVQVANQTLDEAKEAYAIAQRRYNAAVSPLIELSDAQTALTQAESNAVNALYDYNTAEAELDRALGRYANYKPAA